MLPSILKPDTTPETWPHRREELLELFRSQVYGRRPDVPYRVASEMRSTASVLNGTARREIYSVTVSTGRGSVAMELVLILPEGKPGPVPTVLMLSNHDREDIPGSPPDFGALKPVMDQAPAWWRKALQKMMAGFQSGAAKGPELLDISGDEFPPYWSVPEIIASGRAAAAFYASHAQRDDRIQFPSGLTALFQDSGEARLPDGWGTLGVWAFAASCMVDVLEKHPKVDAEKISIGGHSRGGKAALWCAAQDERIHAVLVNNSGCTGAAVSRGKRGEVPASIYAFFPHWFCPNYSQYGWREEEMPFDQHMLVAAVAPRLCYITSGSTDGWSDPNAEWLGAVEGSTAWKLFGDPGLSGSLPAPGTSVTESRIGYHLREGGHDLNTWDWQNFLVFLEKHNG